MGMKWSKGNEMVQVDSHRPLETSSLINDLGSEMILLCFLAVCMYVYKSIKRESLLIDGIHERTLSNHQANPS